MPHPLEPIFEDLLTLFPTCLLSVKPGQVIADPLLWKDNEWARWSGRKEPGARPFSANEMQWLIHTIAMSAAKINPMLLDSGRSRCWTSNTLEKLRTEKGEEVKAPDLILADNRIRHAATWKDVVSVMNVEEANNTQLDRRSEVDARMAYYAEHIFKIQPGRRFVLTFLVVANDFQINVFDRTGPLYCSGKPNIHKNPMDIILIILGTLHLGPQDLGYDPSLYIKSLGIKGLFTQVGGVEYAITPFYQETRMYGRGTVCFYGTSQVDGSLVVIKDQWTDVSRKNRELEILEHLNGGEESSVCAPDGVRVIPKIVAGEIVKVISITTSIGRFNVQSGLWESTVSTFAHVDDTTALMRHPQRSKEGILAHWRIVTAPLAQKIQTFPSLKGMATIFKDIVHGKSTRVYLDRFLHH